LEIIVLEKVHKIKCPHCGKEIYLMLKERKVSKIVPPPPEVPSIPLPEAEKVVGVPKPPITPMEMKKRVFDYISKLPVGTTFVAEEVRKATGLDKYGYYGAGRGIGAVLLSLKNRGYLEVVSEEKYPKGGALRKVWKLVKKLEV